MKTVINIKTDKEIYFSVIPHMSSGLEKLLNEVELDIGKKRNISPAFSSEKELKNHLASL